ncbi:hypothetical protein Tco_1417785 [Tanacetum coccineum]
MCVKVRAIYSQLVKLLVSPALLSNPSISSLESLNHWIMINSRWIICGALDECQAVILDCDSLSFLSGCFSVKTQISLCILDGHSILSLEVSLSGDCDVKKRNKGSYVYAVGSQEYQVVCTIPDIASTDVGVELKLVAVVATSALIIAVPGSRF